MTTNSNFFLSKKKKTTLLLIVASLYILDQITKWIARINIAPQTETDYGELVTVIPGFWYFNHAHNSGIAFGMFNGSAWANVVFGLIAFGAIFAVLIMLKTGGFPGKLSQLASALLISGILGNLTDRLLRGHVTDFLLFDLKFWSESTYFWPSFNVADACICIAATLLIIATFTEEQKQPPKA